MRNHSNEYEFDLHENGRAGETHFHMNGFARRLVLTQRQRVTRKWPIYLSPIELELGIIARAKRCLKPFQTLTPSIFQGI